MYFFIDFHIVWVSYSSNCANRYFLPSAGPRQFLRARSNYGAPHIIFEENAFEVSAVSIYYYCIASSVYQAVQSLYNKLD